MKKHLYSQHDKLANFYNIIQVSDLDPEAFATTLTRSISLCSDVTKLHSLENCETVYVGSYDDETMKFDLIEPKVICDCSSIVAQVISRYERK